MPFRDTFEKNFNDDLQAGPAESRMSDSEKRHSKKRTKDDFEEGVEEEDIEMSEKKDRPPRFSTLFGGTAPPQNFDDTTARSKRKSGVFIPMPLFIVLAAALFFESTLLFGYTIIGLYHNLPFQFSASSTPASMVACDCNKQPSINIAPNFFVPQGQPSTETIAPPLGNPVISGPFPTSFATSTAINQLAASDLLSILEAAMTRTLADTSSSTTTTSSSSSKPTTSATTSLTTSAKSTTSPAPTLVTATSITHVPGPTFTSFKTLPVSTPTSKTSAATSTGKKDSSTEKSAPTPTSKVTPPVSSKTSTTEASKATIPACFGGSGGAELVCPDTT